MNREQLLALRRAQIAKEKEAPDGGTDSSGSPSGASGPFSIVSIRARAPFPGDVKIYPFGVVGRTDRGNVKNKRGNHLQGGGAPLRGAIKTLSPKSAARCREFVVAHDIPGARLVSLTGTTAIGRTPEEWRALLKRYRMRLERKGVSGVWRVELQKRGAPHLHALLWVPQCLDKWQRLLREGWLECIGGKDGEGLQNGEFSHAVQFEEGVGAGWVAYLASHSSKHKKEQLGWLGKQWGVWGAERFVRQEPLNISWCSGPQLARFRRGLRRWQMANLKRKRGYGVSVRPLPCDGQWVRAYAPGVPRRLLDWATDDVDVPF